MYTVGELSKIVNISIDALRYYDEIGLLKPCRVDAKSRYRYYSDEQIGQLLSITEWKQYGFSLDAIRELLALKDPARLIEALQTRLQQLLLERTAIERTIALVEERMSGLKGEQPMRENHVLVIDDAPFMRKIVKDLLESKPTLAVTVAGTTETGEEGIAWFTDRRPALTIVDLGLPDLDGMDVVRRIRTIEPEARIVICSARAHAQTVVEGVRAGASHYIVKPFMPDALVGALHALLGQPPLQVDSETVEAAAVELAADEAESITQDAIDRFIRSCRSSS